MGKNGHPPIGKLIYYTMDIYRKKFSHYNRKELKGYDEN